MVSVNCMLVTAHGIYRQISNISQQQLALFMGSPSLINSLGHKFTHVLAAFIKMILRFLGLPRAPRVFARVVSAKSKRSVVRSRLVPLLALLFSRVFHYVILPGYKRN